jgi:hypothetical protein
MYIYFIIFLILSIIIFCDKKNKKVNNISKENFSNLNPSESPVPSESVLTLSEPKKSNETKLNSNYIINESIIDKLEIELNLIYLNPKFAIQKDENNVNNSNNVNNVNNSNNSNWKNNYLENICKGGGCKCIKNENNKEICGIKIDDKIMECSDKCSNCNQCHNNIPIHEYQSLCNRSSTVELKEKCKLYESRAKFEDINCVFKSKKKEIEKCKMFFIENNNNFFIENDILLKISIIYDNIDEELLNNIRKKLNNIVKDIQIDSFTINKVDKKYNIFYKNKEEVYILFIPKQIDKGISQLIEIEGKVIFNNNLNPIKFKKKYVINIYNLTNNQTNEEIKEDNYNIKSYLANDYSYNYLNPENSVINSKNLVKNSFVNNPIINMSNGVYVREKLIDNPETWKSRSDIARPWILTR